MDCAGQTLKSRLLVLCGNDEKGAPTVCDLTKTNLLIAGDYHTGILTFVKALITNLILANTPEELQLLLIDSNGVDLSDFQELKSSYLISLDDTPDGIISGMEDACIAISSLSCEMKSRYEILQKSGFGNLADYNKNNPPKKLPEIVCVVYDYADLYCTFGSVFSNEIIKLAQLARGVGIHLVLATERVSTNVIDGFVTSLFPSRICFRTALSCDSKLILDAFGAEELNGCGELLFKTVGFIKRVQGPRFKPEEIRQICLECKTKEKNIDPIKLPRVKVDLAGANSSEWDPLLDKAGELYGNEAPLTISMLQRHFYIGYNRAARLMAQLVKAGRLKADSK